MAVRGAYPSDLGARTLVGSRGATQPSPGGSVLGSVAASLLGKALELATLVGLAVVVPRLLRPGDYGHFALALTTVTLGSLALTLGGHTLMARYVPAAPPEERRALAWALGARFARPRVVLIGLIGLAAAVAAAVEPSRFPYSTTALAVGALTFNVLATLVLQVGLGLGRTGAWSARYPLQNSALIALVVLLFPSVGMVGAIAAIAIAGAVGLVFAVLVTVPVLGPRPPDPAVVPAAAHRFGTFQAAGAALMQSTQRGAVLVVAVLASSVTETGYAALAVGIALAASHAILQAFTGVWFVIAGARQDRALRAESVPLEVEPLARSDVWAVYAVECPELARSLRAGADS